MAQVTKKTLIGEALSIDEEIAPILIYIWAKRYCRAKGYCGGAG